MITVILPTYNERKNLEELFKRIDNSLEVEYEILVVDDESPDGTSKKAMELAELYPARIFVREENHGLSQSVINGIIEARGDRIVVMDADLQHPPEKIPKLVEAINGGDMAVGTRFKNDGAVEHWGISRKVISKGAAFIADTVMWNQNLSDPMSGFFAFKKESIDKEDLDAEGFKILLELVHRNDLEVVEVPFQFGERKKGESSLGLAEIVDYVEQMGKITLDKIGFKQSKRIIQFFEFMFVGGTGVFINYLIFLAALFYSLHYSIAGALAFIGALHWNFFWNREITFSKSTKSLRHQYKYFTMVNIGGFLIYEFLLFALIEGIGMWAVAANLVAITGGFLWNFTGSEKLAFN